MKLKIFVIFWVLGVWMASLSFAYFGASTTDISYLLPGGGHFGDTTQNAKWYTDFDTTFNTTTIYFNASVPEPYAVLKTFATPSSYTQYHARIGISPAQVNLDLTNYKRNEFLVSITFRGNTTLNAYGGGTIYGFLQTQVDSKYDNNPVYWWSPRKPGYSPGYMEAVSFKGISVDTSLTTPIYNYSILMVSTTWVTYSWHIIPTAQNYYQLGFLSLTSWANPAYYAYSGRNGPKTDSEIQIKEIKLQLIRRY